MELVSTIEINGEEREIADAVARGHIDGINSNLSQLEYSEFAGGKNLTKIIKYATQSGTYKYLAVGNVYLEKGKTYTMSFTATSNGIGRIYIPNSVGFTDNSPVFVIDSTTIRCKKTAIAVNGNDGKNKVDLLMTASNNEGTVTITDIQFEEGATATDYEPYIPSFKMLAEENSQQSIEAMDLKMLGWTVPRECPIQNEVNGNQFIQKAGRADIGDLAVERQATDGNYFFHCTLDVACESPTQDAYLDGYTVTTIHGWSNLPNLYYRTGEYMGEYFVRIRNDSYTDANSFKNAMKGHYFYYKLATPITKTIDGNEAVAQIKNDLSDCCKKSDITTNETLIGTFNGKNYYRKLFTGISGSGGSITVNVGEKIEIYNYYGRAYTYGQSGASNAKYPIPNNNYYIDSQNASETSFQLTIPTSSDTRKVDLVIEYTKVDE